CVTLGQNGQRPYLPSPPPPANPARVKSPPRPVPEPGRGSARGVCAPPGGRAPFRGRRPAAAGALPGPSARGHGKSPPAPARGRAECHGRGLPARETGSVRSARRGPGHNAAAPRRPGRGAPQTPARLRLDPSVLPRPGSGNCFPPGTGLGLRQVSNAPGGGRGRGQGAPGGPGAPDRHSPRRAPPGPDMSAQEPPQGRRFPIEAGDSPGLAAAPESQDSPEPVATEHNPVRPLRRCPGCHCLTLLHVPIDVYLAMGGSPRARAT
uniref:Family with sequence similarity 229 member A n=2 Tax=Canis lupus familiaris TaxID=9615 RepID=A0A8P0TH44_CANLF